MADDPIGDVVRRQMAQRMDDLIMRTIMGETQTNSVPQPETTLDLSKLLPEWEKMLRNWRREQITVVCDLGHEGPIISHETPTDGTRVEMSWHQLLELHSHWPMKLNKVNSPEQAEFVPISGVFREFVPLHPDPPPWQMRDDLALHQPDQPDPDDNR